MLPWFPASLGMPRKHLSCEFSVDFEATNLCWVLPSWIPASRCKLHVQGSLLSGDSLECQRSGRPRGSTSLATNSTRSSTSSSDFTLYPIWCIVSRKQPGPAHFVSSLLDLH